MASLKQRGKVYYAQYYIGGKQKRVNLGTESLQVAKEKIRQLESSLYRGDAVPLPTKTPIAKVVTDYVEYRRCHKTARSVERDLLEGGAMLGGGLPFRFTTIYFSSLTTYDSK